VQPMIPEERVGNCQYLGYLIPSEKMLGNTRKVDACKWRI